MTSRLFDGIAIISSGQTAYHKHPEVPAMWYLVEATRLALAKANIRNSEVDGLAVSSFMLPPDNTATLAEHMGMTLGWAFLGTFGGASQVVAIMRAAQAIRQGEAEVIVLVAGDSYSVAAHYSLMADFNSAMRDYVAPYGMGGTNGLFAMLERRHSYDFGTTKAQLGKLAVVQRANAQRNPNALLRRPMTLEDYLGSRMICDPIRLYDCVLPCGGGEAIVMTTADRARASGRQPVFVLGGGESSNFAPDDLLMLQGGWTEFAPRMFEDAELGPSEVDMVQLYDDYPIMELIQLEGLGFCERGAGGRYVAETDISLHGDLPINTGGGQLSCGQSGAGGGAIGVTEAVMQLQSEAGDRQVPDARTALVSGFGMVGFTKGLCQAAVLLARR